MAPTQPLCLCSSKALVREGEECGSSGNLYSLQARPAVAQKDTRGAEQECLTECQFADDVALLAITHGGAEVAGREYRSIAQDFGLTMSIVKTKFMVVGHDVTEADHVSSPSVWPVVRRLSW